MAHWNGFIFLAPDQLVSNLEGMLLHKEEMIKQMRTVLLDRFRLELKKRLAMIYQSWKHFSCGSCRNNTVKSIGKSVK